MHRGCAFSIVFAITASAWAGDDARAKFVTNDDADTVKRAACDLAGLDVSVNGARCSPMPMIEGATVVRVSTQPRDDGRVIVFVESDAQDTVMSVGATLKAKLAPPHPPRQEPVAPAPTIFSPALVAFGWASVGIGGLGVGAGAIVAIVSALTGVVGGVQCGLAQNNSCHSNASDFTVAGAVIAGVGALFMIVGGISVGIGGRTSPVVSAYVAPNGGGIRFTW